jgi:hypothetical protein
MTARLVSGLLHIITCLYLQMLYADMTTSAYVHPNFTISGNFYMWGYVFVTPFDPTITGSFDSDETFFTWHLLSKAYLMKVSKRVYKQMSTSANALSTSFSTKITYDVFSTYAYDLSSTCSYDSDGWISNCTAWNFLYADANGVSYYTDVDPVNTGSLVGSIGGAFNYVILAFSVAFGFAIRRKWRALEQIRMESIAAARSMRKLSREGHSKGQMRWSDMPMQNKRSSHSNDQDGVGSPPGASVSAVS